MKKIKVIQMTPFFFPVTGGMEEHVFDTSKMLKKLGYDVQIFTSNKLREGKTEKMADVFDGIKVTRFNSLFHVTKLAPIWPGVLFRMMFEDFDILHMHSYRHQHNLCAFIAKFRGKKVILTPHWPEYPMELRNRIVQKIIPIFDRTIGRLIFASCDMIFADTGAEKDWLIEKFSISKNKIRIITPGISRSEFKIVSTKPFISKYKLAGKKIVVTVARLHRSKGHEQIIKIANHFKDAVFIFIGKDGGEKRFLVEQIKEQGAKNIIIAENVSDTEKLQALRAADVFCLPTQYEGFGIALAEAMAQGTPIIATDVAAVPWVIKGCGYVFKNHDSKDLEDKLRSLLYDAKLRKQYSINALKRAKGFTFDEIIKQLKAAYAGLCVKK